MTNEITLYLDVNDVRLARPDLTEPQASAVLDEIKRHKVTQEFIAQVSRKLFPLESTGASGTEV
jgi:hypothetical protein